LDVMYRTLITKELLKVTIMDSFVEGKVVLSCQNHDICSVLPAGEYLVNVLFQVADTKNFIPVEKVVPVMIRRYSFDIYCADCREIVYGTILSTELLDVKLLDESVEGRFVITSDSSNNPLRDTLTAGEHLITTLYQPTDGVNFIPISKATIVTVLKFTPIVRSLEKLVITYGTILTPKLLEVVCENSDIGGEFMYSCVNLNVDPLNELLSAGLHMLTILFHTFDTLNYIQVERVVKVEVERYVPEFECVSELDIVYRTVISEELLKVQCNTPHVGGKFIFSEISTSTNPIGQVLSAGVYSISILYQPPNIINYVPVQKFVNVMVRQYSYAISCEAELKIVYGTVVTSEMLKVTCCDETVMGGFVFNCCTSTLPPIGDLLPAGSHVIVVKYHPSDEANYIVVEKRVSIEVEKCLPSIELVNTIRFTYETVLTKDMISFESSVEGTVQYSPPLLLNSDEFYTAGEHRISLLFMPQDEHNYFSVESNFVLTVDKFIPKITWDENFIMYYNKFHSRDVLNATCVSPGAFVYYPNNSDLENLDVGTYPLIVIFTPTNPNYAVVEAVSAIEIKPTLPTLQWPRLDSIPYGTALSVDILNSFCEEKVDGQFIYEPSFGTVLDAGSYQLKAQFFPYDKKNYLSAQLIVDLVVDKVYPTIAWTNPSDIIYEDKLKELQLNAILVDESILGQFYYSPPLGYVLDVGEQKLTVEFIPSSSNYLVSAAVVNILVHKKIPHVVWNNPHSITWPESLSQKQLAAQLFDEHILGSTTYTPSIGYILEPGWSDLLMSFQPFDGNRYVEVNLTVQIFVEKCPIRVKWDQPNSITYSTLLSETQLNASLDMDGHEYEIKGHFDFQPPLNTLLVAGTHSLTATFCPDDEVHYIPVTICTVVTIVPLSPPLLWANPFPINYESELNVLQLNARVVDSSIIGSFKYFPDFGTVLPAGVHPLMVTFYPLDTLNYEVSTHKAEIVIEKNTPTIVWSASKIKALTYGDALNQLDHLNAVFANKNVKGSITYNPPLGTILTAGKHVLKVICEPYDNANYLPAHKKISIIVKKSKPVIQWSEKDICYPTPLGDEHLDATCSHFAGVFEYYPPVRSLLNAGQHTIVVRFIPDDMDNFEVAVASTLVTVHKGLPTIIWEPDGGNYDNKSLSITVYYGIPLSNEYLLNATCLEKDIIGTFSYNYEMGTILCSGTHHLHVLFTPTDTDNYCEAKKVLEVIVMKIDPVIEFNNPEDLYFGDVLSPKQLNAKINSNLQIDGQFLYIPSLGDRLDVGNHTIRVKFTPTDGSNFNVAEKVAFLTVHKFKPRIIWFDPPSIEYDPNGLNDTQLNAVVETQLDGHFDFDPPIGRVLKPGHHVLHARFIPADLGRFEVVDMSVNMHIKRILPTIIWEPPKSLVIVAEKAPPMEIFNAICIDDIKGRFDYTYKYVLKEQTSEESSYSGGLTLLERVGVCNSDNYKYDCLMTVSFQPEAKYSGVYSNAKKTIAIPTIGIIPITSDIYPRDRVTTLYPYGDRFYSDGYGKQS